MDEKDIARLRCIGFAPVWAERVASCSANAQPTAEPMRVVSVHRETLEIDRGDAEYSARVWPRLIRELQARGETIATGDWVLAGRDAHRAWWVQMRVPPISQIARRDGDGRRHAVVSNVDAALVLMGLDDDFNLRRVERFLSLVLDSAIQAVVVLTKAGLAAAKPPRLEQCLEAVRPRLPAGTVVMALDATAPTAAEALQPYLGTGRTLVLLGSSGAGKSTLTNTLVGSLVQDTGAVRESDLRGQHTTSSRALFRLSGGACVIDTPGVRTLSPLGNDATLSASFGDIEALDLSCRFRDCRHSSEPGCAVLPTLDADRLNNYHKLLREMRRDSMASLERRQQLAEWKARGRAGSARLKAKRGER